MLKTSLLKTIFTIAIAFVIIQYAQGQKHSIARQWNDALLQAIENDFARPPVHARNLFHISLGMYDAWAVYDQTATTFLLNSTVGNFTCPFTGIQTPYDLKSAREEATSYAAYRLMRHRFKKSPGAKKSFQNINSLMAKLGYDTLFVSTDYTTNSPAALGNYIAQKVIEFGLQDGSNERDNYKSRFYAPFNPPFKPLFHGNLTIKDPNRWQPLDLNVFIDQSGQVVKDGE